MKNDAVTAGMDVVDVVGVDVVDVVGVVVVDVVGMDVVGGGIDVVDVDGAVVEVEDLVVVVVVIDVDDVVVWSGLVGELPQRPVATAASTTIANNHLIERGLPCRM